MITLCKITGTIALIHSIVTFAILAYFRVPTELFIVFVLAVEFAIGIVMFIRHNNSLWKSLFTKAQL